MSQCWKDGPFDRPTFSQLCVALRRMLDARSSRVSEYIILLHVQVMIGSSLSCPSSIPFHVKIARDIGPVGQLPNSESEVPGVHTCS